MRERPILFSAPMVRAIQAGTKTQTRRVVKPQPLGGAPTLLQHLQAFGHERWATDEPDEEWVWKCPYGQPGDRLWVKETTLKVEDHGWIGPVYAESEQGRFAFEWGYGEPDDPYHIPPHAIKCRPSLFMKRAMSRITLEVTGVRVERLQDINRGDAMAEGCPFPNMAQGEDPRRWFVDLWQQINGPGSWDANPWVWVVEFRRTQEGE